MKKKVIGTSVAGVVTFCSVTGCATLENKASALAGGVDAFKVETAGSLSTGTLLPNIIAGGAVSAIATAPAVPEGAQTQVIFVQVKRNSFWGALFGIDAATEAVTYIGAPGESPEATQARFAAFTQLHAQK